MNLYTKEEYIEEKVYDSNIAYILKDNSLFLPIEYKVLQNQVNDCFVKCMKLLYNGKVQIYYLVNGYKNLIDMLPNLDADSFMTIISNFISNVIDVKNNGFLSCRNIDISFQRIYIDPSTYKVHLVYIPLNKRIFHDEAVFENELRTSLVKLISGVSGIISPKTAQFTEDLSNGMLTLQDLCRRTKGRPKSEDANHCRESVTMNSRLRIVALNAPVKVSVEVNKDSFVIGKNAAADGVISFNKMISRIHCRINRNGREYSITDLGSANGTYVNREKLQQNVDRRIKNGDIVRLANSDFQVVID